MSIDVPLTTLIKVPFLFYFILKKFNVQVKIINSGSKRYEIGRQKILHNAVT
jgi:hypothetical protein